MPDADPNPAPSVPPEQHAVLYDEVGKLVTASGGVSGLVQQFEQKGLGGVIGSWVNSGPNSPIGGEQVLDLVGRDKILAIAAKGRLVGAAGDERHFRNAAEGGRQPHSEWHCPPPTGRANWMPRSEC